MSFHNFCAVCSCLANPWEVSAHLTKWNFKSYYQPLQGVHLATDAHCNCKLLNHLSNQTEAEQCFWRGPEGGGIGNLGTLYSIKKVTPRLRLWLRVNASPPACSYLGFIRASARFPLILLIFLSLRLPITPSAVFCDLDLHRGVFDKRFVLPAPYAWLWAALARSFRRATLTWHHMALMWMGMRPKLWISIRVRRRGAVAYVNMAAISARLSLMQNPQWAGMSRCKKTQYEQEEPKKNTAERIAAARRLKQEKDLEQMAALLSQFRFCSCCCYCCCYIQMLFKRIWWRFTCLPLLNWVLSTRLDGDAGRTWGSDALTPSLISRASRRSYKSRDTPDAGIPSMLAMLPYMKYNADKDKSILRSSTSPHCLDYLPSWHTLPELWHCQIEVSLSPLLFRIFLSFGVCKTLLIMPKHAQIFSYAWLLFEATH